MTTKTPNSDAPATLVEAFKQMQHPIATNPAYSAQIEQFWDAQEKMLAETEAFAQHWFQRRHEAVRTALDVARSASSGASTDPSDALRKITEWQRHSTERLVADAQEWFDIVSRCATYVAETEAGAVGQAVEDIAETARSATASAKSEPV